MLPGDPRHGTYAGAQAHIRASVPMCDPCRESWLRYRRTRRRDHIIGRKRMIPAQPVIDHLLTLRAAGVIAVDIANRAGVSYSLVDELLNRPRATIRSDNAAALLATKPPPTPTGLIDATGSIRRIHALGRVGWGLRDITIASGQRVKFETLRRISSARPAQVTVATADAISTAYGELSMKLPPSGRTSSQIRSKAAKKGWAPPLAWDAIDDPDETPRGHDRNRPMRHHTDIDPTIVDRLAAGEPVEHSTRDEKRAAMARWLAAGNSEQSLCRIHGWKDGRYTPRRSAA